MAARQDGLSAPLHALSAVDLAAAYRRGDVDPVTVLDAVLARTAEVDPTLNALVTKDATAHEQAAASARRFASKRPIGPLDGIPVAVKDNLLVRGVRTTWGTAGLSDHVPDRDELPVARLRAAGAVIVGKTNVPEFTLEGYTANPLFGVTRNPWDTRLTPGGSSGGSVAGCAAGEFPLALCTDGGGSIRRPAAHTGLVGFKPSIGAIPRAGGLPQLLLDFEVVGPVARTVADAKRLFEALSGTDARDPASSSVPRLAANEGPLSVLAVRAFGDAPVDREILASFDAACDALAELGHRVERAELPLSLEAVNAFWPIVGQVGLARLFADQPLLAQHASPRYVEMAALGRRVGDAQWSDGLATITRFRRDTAALFGRIDVVATPTTASLPWPAEEAYPATIDGRSVGPRGHAVFTGWVNACGNPAISVRAGLSGSGLPIGLQLVGAFGADETLLALAASYESAQAPPRFPSLD